MTVLGSLSRLASKLPTSWVSPVGGSVKDMTERDFVGIKDFGMQRSSHAVGFKESDGAHIATHVLLKSVGCRFLRFAAVLAYTMSPEWPLFDRCGTSAITITSMRNRIGKIKESFENVDKIKFLNHENS
jgi:hypothetical protein